MDNMELLTEKMSKDGTLKAIENLFDVLYLRLVPESIIIEEGCEPEFIYDASIRTMIDNLIATKDVYMDATYGKHMGDMKKKDGVWQIP